MSIADLPALNATLNAISAVLLVVAYVLIRNGQRKLHQKFMLAALTTSACFLVSYLVYHANVGSRPFTGRGAARVVYFAVLLTHVVLAATILPLALITTARGLSSQFDRHVRIARWTFPIWVYVSVTGVIVYVMLYQMTWA